MVPQSANIRKSRSPWSNIDLQNLQLNNSLCATIHQIQRLIRRLTLRSSRDYLIRLNWCRIISLWSKVTRTPCTIWRVISRIEVFDSKYYHHKSKLTEMFLFMVIYVERYIFNFSQVYNLNNDVNEPDMNISMTSNLVTGWVYTLIHITPHQRAAMVITEGFTGWITVLDSLVFTVNTV